MRPTFIQQAALGASLWVPVNQLQIAFGIGLGVTLSSGASLTYTVQHTFDDPGAQRPVVAITRSGTVATVVDPAHGLSVNDNILISGAGDPNLNGSFAVASVVDANTYTYTVANTGATSALQSTVLQSFRVFNHASLAAQTTRQDGNYAFPIQAIRLSVGVYASGVATLTILQAMGR